VKSDQATLILRLPPAMHRRLKDEARSADTSLNAHCRALLSRRPPLPSVGEPALALSLAAGRSHRTEPLADLVSGVLGEWREDIEGLVLFGSFARGRHTTGSDVDLLVVLGRRVTLDRDVYGRWRSRTFEGRALAPLFAHAPAAGERIGGLWFEVALDGIVLYDQDLKLSRFLSDARRLIAEGHVKRRVTHGHPYWVHGDPAGEIPVSSKAP